VYFNEVLRVEGFVVMLDNKVLDFVENEVLYIARMTTDALR